MKPPTDSSDMFTDIIVTPNQLTAAALVIQYWVDRDKVNPGVFIAVFLVAIVVINYLGIKFFGGMSFRNLTSIAGFR